MSDLPLVSVITPSFNQGRFLETTIRSVLAQDYPKIEYIVIDGGSTDDSLQIIKRYERQLAYWSSESDRGQADAINKGFRQAKGELVAWLNSDDAYLPGAIAEAVEAASRNPDSGMVYGDGLMVDAELRLLDPHRYRALDAEDLLAFEVILQPAVFIRRRILEEVGYLNEAYHLILDHELWVRIAGRARLHHVGRFWALERSHMDAKTIHQASGFVEEAQRLVSWASESQEFGETVRRAQRRVHAGLNVFCARRLIDAGEHRRAVAHLRRAIRMHPPTAGRYWYKVIQGYGSALGLEPIFLGYRWLRRQVQHKNRRIELPFLLDDTRPESGAVLNAAEDQQVPHG